LKELKIFICKIDKWSTEKKKSCGGGSKKIIDRSVVLFPLRKTTF